jgi:hypothetical protein
MPTPSDAPTAVRELADELSKPRPMRRGSLSERRVKCGKAACACGVRPEARHGPYYSLTRAVNGQTRSRFLRGQEAAIVREQIEAGQQFRKKVDLYWEKCEQWADEEMEAQAAPEGGAKKGASKRPSKQRLRRRSSAKSKRS